LHDSAVATWLRLSRVSTKIEHAAAVHLRGHGLTLGQFDILTHVGAHQGVSQQGLADSLLVTKGNVTQLLDRMAQSGLLERRQQGRTNTVFLTPAGESLLVRVLGEHEAMIGRQFASLNAAEVTELRRLLRGLDQALD
jgi:DNA-binding MarR family transcriptional regulator